MDRVAHLCRIKFADGSPQFVALSVEKNECGRKFETVNRCEFAANGFLNVQSYEEDLILEFHFELVHDGLDRGASNSIGRLKFKQDGLARADHLLHLFGIVH